MACFIAPLAEAAVVSIVKKNLEKKSGSKKDDVIKKLGWLNKMLFGGSFLLAIEHVWHGEIIPSPPFLTGLNAPGEMFLEIATAGLLMCGVVTGFWGLMVLISSHNEKNKKALQAGEGV